MVNLDELEAYTRLLADKGSPYAALHHGEMLRLLARLRAAEAVVEAAKSVAAEDVVKDSLLCFVMGGELLDRLDRYDAVVGEI